MPVILPWQSLEQDTLHRLLSELVSRDGTDYGDDELTTEQKVRQAKSNLERGRAVLCWDEQSESASLLDPVELSKMNGELQ